jgi:hypothetical protein
MEDVQSQGHSLLKSTEIPAALFFSAAKRMAIYCQRLLQQTFMEPSAGIVSG